MDHGLAGLLRWFVETLQGVDGTTALVSLTAVLLLCGLGLPIPEDILLVTTGILAALGKFPLGLGIALCLVAVLCGDAVLFFTGRRLGPAVLDGPWAQRAIGPRRVAQARSLVQENARFICFVARFLPGVRSGVYLAAGALGVPPRTYLTQDGLAALISVPFWVVVGWWFAHSLDTALEQVQRFEGLLLAAVVVAIVGYVVVQWRASRAIGDEEMQG